MKKYVSFAIKATLTLIILYLVLAPIPLQEYRKAWILFSVSTLLSLFILVVSQVFLLAFRWYLLAKSAGSNLSISTSIFGILISFFFSQGLPASVGYDAFRLWWHRKEGLSTSSALKIIFFDRVYGMLSLVLLCLCSALILLYLLGDTSKIITLVLFIGIVGMLLGLLIMPTRLGLSNQIERLLIYMPNFLTTTLRWFIAARHSLSQQKLSMTLYLLGTGLFIHLLVVSQVYILGHALSPDNINFVVCLGIVPPVLFISYMPFSIAGWGVREASMVVAFGLLGVPAGTAILISLGIGMSMLVISLVGGALWMASGFRGTYVKSS